MTGPVRNRDSTPVVQCTSRPGPVHTSLTRSMRPAFAGRAAHPRQLYGQWAVTGDGRGPSARCAVPGWSGGWPQRAHADFVGTGEQVGRVCVDPVGTGAFELLPAIAAGHDADPDRPGPPGSQQVPHAVTDDKGVRG